jgi:hypothetical protein
VWCKTKINNSNGNSNSYSYSETLFENTSKCKYTVLEQQKQINVNEVLNESRRKVKSGNAYFSVQKTKEQCTSRYNNFSTSFLYSCEMQSS